MEKELTAEDLQREYQKSVKGKMTVQSIGHQYRAYTEWLQSELLKSRQQQPTHEQVREMNTITINEIWDFHADLISDNIDSLKRVVNKAVMFQDEFHTALTNFAQSYCKPQAEEGYLRELHPEGQQPTDRNNLTPITEQSQVEQQQTAHQIASKHLMELAAMGAKVQACYKEIIAAMEEYRNQFKAQSPVLDEETIKELKGIRNYFGEHDITPFEHHAYYVINRIINGYKTAKEGK